MSAKDYYHPVVKQALVKAGWKVTHDPLFLKWAKRKLFVDIGAEKLIGAENNQSKIAVEVKSFISDSKILDLEKALGQYILYQKILEQTEPERTLYLAIPAMSFEELFIEDKFADILLVDNHLKLIVFNPQIEEIVKWIP
ncbi:MULTISPECIES: element excision factor XisH family protein [unclassified Microcoleus]|uniref:element excision factor XisH family protein n=1 Tax=unclassified Microcoleus TaxID=2642155 RepID=UPI002FD62FA8